jgi:hypothetical protein
MPSRVAARTVPGGDGGSPTASPAASSNTLARSTTTGRGSCLTFGCHDVCAPGHDVIARTWFRTAVAASPQGIAPSSFLRRGTYVAWASSWGRGSISPAR